MKNSEKTFSEAQCKINAAERIKTGGMADFIKIGIDFIFVRQRD